MAEKVFVGSDNTATLTCPNCKHTRVADVSKYMRADAPSRLKARCPCGNSFLVSLEKRKHFRKEARLEGIYRYSPGKTPGDESEQQGLIQVLDISKSGLRIKLNSRPRFQVGDLIDVEFRLDDSQQSLIRRSVYVRNIKNLVIGLEYASHSSLDSVLGFYLFN